MSVQLSHAAVSPKAVASAESTGGKGKVKSGDPVDGLAEGGFSAILTSLEPPAEPSAGANAADAEINAVVDAPLTPQDVLQSTALLPAVPPAVLPDTAVALPPSLPSELAMLLSQAGVVNGDKLSSAIAANTGTVPTEKLLGGARAGVQQVINAVRADKAEPATAKLPVAASGMGGEMAVVQQNAKALLDPMASASAGGNPNPNAKGIELKSGAAAVLAESRALNASFQPDAVAREPALSVTLLTSGLGDGFLRQAERTVSRSAAHSEGSGLEGIWGQSAFQVNHRVDVPTVVIDPSTQSFESTVADTVSYWATNGVQNAELKLDGFNGESIAVSISLKGDEAHIGFRTDKPETRQLLEGAVAHLKDLLTSEGLVLSGVSVGSSGQGRSGTQEQQNQPGTRQATLVRQESEPAEAIQRVNKPTGRALDLFV